MADTKKLLSEAQKCVQNKDFENAIAKCKTILKEDKNNSLACILLGAAYKDSDRTEAIRYLKLGAIENPKKALPGLFHCAESEDQPDICEQLLEFTPQKYPEIHKKLASIAMDLKDVSSCLNILSNETLIHDNDERRSSAYIHLAQIFSNLTDINEKWIELCAQTLNHLLEINSLPNEIGKLYNFLEILHKQKRLDMLISMSCKIANQCQNQTTPLEWICKIYCEIFYNVTDTKLKDVISGFIENYSDRLLAISPSSVLGLMAQALHNFAKNNYLESRTSLLKVNNLQPNWSTCLRTLSAIYCHLRAYSIAEYFYRRMKMVDLNFARCLVEQNTKDKNEETIKICKELLPNADPKDQPAIVAVLAKALIQNKQYDAGTKTISKLTSMDENEKASLLRSLIYKLEGNIEAAMETLDCNPIESCDFYLEMGQLNMISLKYSAALSNFLKATKLEPFNSDCYFWLGKVYLSTDDKSKASKCFEKCVILHPQHEQGAFLLSAIYRENLNWEANSNLLQMAVNAVPGVQCNWARIQLGFHYLGLHNFNESINSFRDALRSDVDSMSSWEGLADAYLQRGSFNSALKVYQKISEMNPKNPYPKLQVANIKTTLRLHSEAIESYQSLLKEHPKYFAGLKGIAEAHLGLANHYLSQRLLGRSKNHAVKAVQFLTESIMIKSNFACLWRLLANAFESIASLPIGQASLSIPGSLANVNNEIVTISGDKLFEMASRFYCRALKIRPSDALIWYELSLNYYMRALMYGNETSKTQQLKLAAESSKHAIKIAPSNWKNWNLLGIICTTKEIDNLQLAQHCFIKALTIDKKSAVPWANLGILYLLKDDIKLANKAFSRAQQSDTGFINAWTGQALIAELIAQDDEAIDLFKHCTSLGYTPESAIGFAHWVCQALSQTKYQNDARFKYAIENLHAIPLGLDSITWLCKSEEPNMSLESICFLGYLCYQQRLYRLAINAFKQAVSKASKDIKDKMLCNLGYSFLKNNQPIEATESFQSVAEATFESTIGLALSHFKASQYEESYSVYESALQWLATDDKQKALILVAMSAMVYSFQGEKDAKTLLFQCIGLPDPPTEGLFAGCALGILHEDMQLSGLVLQELKRFETNSKYAHHVVFLTSQFMLKSGGSNKALIYILSKVHEYPNNALIRKLLANFLLQNYKKSEKYLTGCSQIAQSSIRLQMHDLKCENTSIEAAKSLAMASEAMRYVDKNIRQKLAEKAVHLNPTCKEAWSALILCTS